MWWSWKGLVSAVAAFALVGLPLLAAPNVTTAPPPARQQQQSPPAQQGPEPGMVNYVEGQASVGGQSLNANSAGKVQVQPGQMIETQNGRVEMLLSPGTLIRLDNNSAVRLDSNGLADVEVTVVRGRAMVESDQLLKDEFIGIHVGPSMVRLMKHGLYDFDATGAGMVRVFDGIVKVNAGNKDYTVRGGHDFDLNATKLKARGFDKKKYEGTFYRWSSLRSSYLAEANADAARGFANGNYGAGFYAGYGYPYDPGWFWDPYFDAYTWLPWDGYFFSPFGWGFYSPGFAFAAPFYGYGFGGFHRFGPGYRPLATGGIRGGGFGNGFGRGGFHGGAVRGGGFAGGGFRGGAVRSGGGFAGGGFRGGGGVRGGGFAGGGFHGGGGGGRR